MSGDETGTPERKKVGASDTRSFWTMVVLATQNAFNDKAAQTMLTVLGVFILNAVFRAQNAGEMSPEVLSTASSTSSAWVPLAFGALILAPFILLAPIAGWISDRFSKTRVLRAGALMQVCVLGLIVYAINIENYTLGIVGFGLLALQSTILSPAKKGIVKEMMGSEKLGSASGVLELSSVLAICLGQIISGFWFDSRNIEPNSPWDAAYWPVLLLFIFSIPAYLASHSIKVYPSPGKRPFKKEIIWEHLGQMKDLLGDSKIRLSALAIAFFWFIGGFINIVAIQVANQITESAKLTSASSSGMGTELAYLLASASGGMILGGALASFSSRRSIELGLVPIGGLLMVIGSLSLVFVPTDGDWFKFWIGFTGFGASMFLVPLNAHLQDNCAEGKRGKVIAGSNLLDCIAGAIGIGLFSILLASGVSINKQFIIIAVLCLAVTIYATRILPQHFVRFTVLTVIRIFYRQKALHAERLPAEGGVLIVPNHVTYLDAFILTAASKRPIRFLMYDSYFKKAGLVRFFIKFFDTVPISEKRAKEAIQKAADAVAEGGVVCIFPEGQLTRSGCMNELKRGFEMIARKAKCPVVPVYMDGLWGSIFSFERGKFIYKWPYRMKYGVTVAWGEPMHAREATAVAVREKLSQLSAESFLHRDVLQKPLKSACGGSVKVKQASKSSEVVGKLTSEISTMSDEKVHGLVYNALQISEIHALRKKDTIALHVSELGDAAHVLTVILPKIGRYNVVLIDETTTVDELKIWHQQYALKNYFGGDKLRHLLDSAGLTEVPIYLVNGDEATERCYPVKVVGQRVVAMSMPHPIAVTATNQFQAGWKASTYGRVLPGYRVDEDGEGNIIYDPQSNAPIIEASVDNEGFMLVGE
jgi:acyl-[acyl-carrier-protein]-phospholipid O-acyltransferase/long-chain-fatty-acid--[acyl-carrier-protein] ligase